MLEDSTPLNLTDNVVVIAWEGSSTVHSDSQGVYYRTYTFDGTPIDAGEQLVMPTAVTGDQTHLAITKYAAGAAYAIGFEGFESGTDGYHVAPLATFVNVAPVGSDNNIVINEDQVYVLAVSDFGYSDADGDSFGGVEINNLPVSGRLLIGGVDAVVGQFVDATSISTGQLTYVAAQDFFTTNDDSFGFIVNDGDRNSLDDNLLTFSVTPLNDSVQIGTNNILTVDEGDTGVVISNSYLNTTDVDDSSLDIEYEIVTDVVNGSLFSGGSQLSVGSRFTQEDIDTGRLTYNHDGLESTGDLFRFVVRDGLEDGAASSVENFVIDVDPVNDEQTITVSISPVPINQGATLTLTTSHLSASDVDNTDAELVFTITTPPLVGQIEVDGLPAASFTQQNLIDGRVTYVNNGTPAITDQFQFTVDDGQGTVSAGTLNFSLTFTEGLVFSTAGDHSDGPTNWDHGDAVSFGGGSLAFGSPTDGESTIVIDTTYDLDGLHFVSQAVTINTPGAPTVLLPGDVLFSVDDSSDVTLPGSVVASQNDIIVFRPVTPGNYDVALGTFSILTSVPTGTFGELWGLTLVERDTWIGDHLANEGEILFTSKDPLANDIRILEITATANNFSVLIDGDEIGIDESIMGIDLIEQDVTVGGVTLRAGTLLLSAEKNENVGAAGVDEDGNWQLAGWKFKTMTSTRLK